MLDRTYLKEIQNIFKSKLSTALNSVKSKIVSSYQATDNITDKATPGNSSKFEKKETENKQMQESSGNPPSPQKIENFDENMPDE